jgi:hypothetical protein
MTLFAKGKQRQSCDVLEASLWYELIVTGPNGVSRLERYTERAAILRRQHELVAEWKAQGWREVEAEPVAVRQEVTRRSTKIHEARRRSTKVRERVPRIHQIKY